jgi:hypothetical protein
MDPDEARDYADQGPLPDRDMEEDSFGHSAAFSAESVGVGVLQREAKGTMLSLQPGRTPLSGKEPSGLYVSCDMISYMISSMILHMKSFMLYDIIYDIMISCMILHMISCYAQDCVVLLAPYPNNSNPVESFNVTTDFDLQGDGLVWYARPQLFFNCTLCPTGAKGPGYSASHKEVSLV